PSLITYAYGCGATCQDKDNDLYIIQHPPDLSEAHREFVILPATRTLDRADLRTNLLTHSSKKEDCQKKE
ncbi:Hypothetical predicted protein, partial [Marmota monax]